MKIFRATLRRLFCAISLITVFSLPSFAQETGIPQFKGPVNVRNQRPYQTLFLSFPPQAADVLPAQQARHAASLDLISDLLIPDPALGAAVTEDTEAERVNFLERRGLGRQWEAAASLPLTWRNGGFLDELVNDYHRLVGLTAPTADVDLPRLTIPSYRSIIEVIRPDGTVAVHAGAAFGPGDLSLFAKHGLWLSSASAGALRIGVKLPLGDPDALLGSGAVDSGLDFDAQTMPSRHFAVYTNLSSLWLGRDHHLDNTTSEIGEYMIALEDRATDSASWVVQFEGEGTAYRTGNSFADGPQRILTVAYKRSFTPRTVWTFAFTENGDIHGYHDNWISDIGSDFVISLGAEWAH